MKIRVKFATIFDFHENDILDLLERVFYDIIKQNTDYILIKAIDTIFRVTQVSDGFYICGYRNHENIKDAKHNYGVELCSQSLKLDEYDNMIEQVSDLFNPRRIRLKKQNGVTSERSYVVERADVVYTFRIYGYAGRDGRKEVIRNFLDRGEEHSRYNRECGESEHTIIFDEILVDMTTRDVVYFNIATYEVEYSVSGDSYMDAMREFIIKLRKEVN